MNKSLTVLVIPACLLLLSCLGPAAGESPGPSRDTPRPPCLHSDHPCTSPSVSDSSGTSASQDSDAKEAFQTSTPSSEHTPHKTPEAEITRNFNPKPKGDDQEATEDEDVEQEYATPEAERVLDCILSSVPLIGGKWFTKMLRHSFSDSTLLEASHSFLDGGELVARFIDLGTTSTAAKMINILGSCFEEEDKSYTSEAASGHSEAEGEYQNDYLESVSNSVERNRGPGRAGNVPPRSKVQTSSPSLPNHRKKRRLTRSTGYGDSLLGFNLLAFLVVGALLTYLVYLLI